MKRLAFTLLAVSLCVAADDVKKEQDKLKGKWKVVSLEREGKELEELKDRDILLTFDGNNVKFTLDGQEIEGTYKVDVSKNPKTIDITFNGEERLGIYQLDGDALKVCGGEPGDERPTEFKTKEGSKFILSIYKREKK